MEEKRRELAGQLRFRIVATRDTIHGGLKGTIEMDEDQWISWIALRSIKDKNGLPITFSADVFELENESFGTERA